MKIVTLMENTACREDIAAEHGLSLYIETGDKKILFDAGQSDAFARNAEILDVDLTQVDFAVLSHGHYDHGDGLKHFLARNQTAAAYVSSYAFGAYYNSSGKYIGVDPIVAQNERVVLVDGQITLAPGITLLSCKEKPLLHPIDSGNMNVLEEGKLRPDTFPHEQYLLIEEAGRRILISGCSHRGILNIASWFRPDILVGGFHFMDWAPEGEPLRQAAQTLRRYPTVYYTGHCTGQRQYAVMKEIMGEQLHYLCAGTVVVL